jgi:hypothetical protein
MINSIFVVLHRQVGRLAPKRTAGMNDDLEPQLDRLGIRFVGSNVHRMFQRGHEILPSPICPVRTASLITATVFSTWSLATATSRRILGRKFRTASVPGKNSIPLGRPKPLISVMVIPVMSSVDRAPADLVNLEVLDKRGDNFHCSHPLIAGILHAGILHLLASPVPKSSRLTCLLAQFNPAVRCRSRSPRAGDEVSDPPRYRKAVEFPGNCS